MSNLSNGAATILSWTRYPSIITDMIAIKKRKYALTIDAKLPDVRNKKSQKQK